MVGYVCFCRGHRHGVTVCMSVCLYYHGVHVFNVACVTAIVATCIL